MQHTKKTLAVMALALASALTACATVGTGDGYSPDAVTVVQVTNNNPNRVVIDAVSLGIDRRLGEVETNQTQSFILPASISLTDLQIRVDPIGPPGSFVSPRVLADLGDVIEVTVQPNLGATSVSVT